MILTVTLNTSIDKLYLVPRITPETVMRVREVSNTAGGKGLNVSRVAAKLGEDVTAMGFTGGFNGRYLESLLTEPRIRRAFTHTDAQTRCCINCWDEATGRSTEFLEPGAPVTEEEAERFFADFARELPGADAVAISGSTPAGISPDAYPRLIEMCRAVGKPVLLDTSGERLVRGAEAKPTFIKPNADEIAQLLGRAPQGREELIGEAVKLHEGGIRDVVISLGADGALMVTDEGVFTGRPPRIEPKNTVGCGDSMVAGFAVGIARGLSPEERLRTAVAVSAANALSFRTGDFAQEDYGRIIPQVTVERL